MRNLGAPIIIDLVSGGAPSVAVTPGASPVPVLFTTGQLKQQVAADNWPCAAGIMTRSRLTFDQASSGGSAVAWDNLFRCIDSFNVFVPNVGTTHSKDAYSGPAAKHIMEFSSSRYRYVDHARAVIPSTDGDTVIDLYVFLPFVNEAFIEPRDFMPWVGWLLALQVTISVAASTTIAAVSTGAVTKAPCSVQAWLEAFVLNEPCIPVFNQWNKYTQAAAAGSTNLVLQNVGQSNGLLDPIQGCRLAAVYEAMSPLGLGGTSTADVYTGFTCADLGQDFTVNIDGIVASFLRAIGHRGPIAGAGASGAAVADGAGNPYTMAALPNGLLNDVALAYMPWRFAGTEQKITNLPKWRMGNLSMQRTFSATPTSGSYLVFTNEIRQLGRSGTKGLLDAANIAPEVRARMRTAFKNKGEGARRGQADIMPLAIPTRG